MEPSATRQTVGMVRRLVLLSLLGVAACTGTGDRALPTASDDPEVAASEAATSEFATPGAPERSSEDVPGPTSAAAPRPDWLGTRVLADGPRGFPEPVDTPPELVDRRFAPAFELPVPVADEDFHGELRVVSDEVAARSTWSPGCPVGLDELAHLVVSFWGFDDRPHTGELLVHVDVAMDLVEVFRQLFEARFPIEQLGIATPADLDAPPTGDGNTSGSFVCRAVRGGTGFSEHASGMALDLNPFHNPYVKDGRVLPELAGAYLDRENVRPGMILPGDVATTAFAAIGWTWGGDFRSLTDPMHFSRDGG